MRMEDIIFLRDKSLSFETINDFRTILSRQRKVILNLFGREGSSPDSEEEEEVKVSYEKSEIQEKIAEILLSFLSHTHDFSDILLDVALILAAFTRFMGTSRSDELQTAVANELFAALRSASEKDLLCDVLLAMNLHFSNYTMGDDHFFGLIDILVWKYSLTSQDVEITRAMILLLSSILKPKPRMAVDEAFNLLPILSAALHSSDTRTISYAATALGYLFEEEGSEEIMTRDNTIAPTLVQLMMHGSVEVVEAALKAVGNILSGDESMTQAMIELQVVPSLLWLVDYPNSKIRKEALWSLSNIAAGSQSQIQALIDASVVPRIMPFMKDWASESKEEKERYEETAWLLANILSSGSNSQKRYLLNEKVFEAFCGPLRNLTPLGTTSKQVLLEGISNLLCLAEEDFAGSKEVVSSLFKKEKLLDLLLAMKESDLPPPLIAWLGKVLDLVKELSLE